MTSADNGWTPLVCVVDFNHARGPEIESWYGVEEGSDPAVDYEWPLIPFMALSDGAHASFEDFSYFTLLKPATPTQEPTSLFGISCTRQLAATELKDKPAEVTRSTVQKAVVVIADSPHLFGMLRERLSVVTSAWFAQKDFTETEILKRFQDRLKEESERGRLEEEKERDQYLGMSLRQLIREFKWQTLVLFKCCLLQPKMLFFGTKCERLCMMQFSLVSLIPGLIRKLQDAADPSLNNYERNLIKPSSLKTSDRNSLLSYMGLPLQIFGKGSMFGPYTPLQQLDILADIDTKSYIVGSTNSLLLQQRDRYNDILINLDESTITISSISLRTALNLSTADRRWIDFITQSVNDTWDDANPERPNTMGYVGSEEFIRLQFEEYLLSLISSVKCHNYMQANAHNPNVMLPQIEGDPTNDFDIEWIEAWTKTENYRLWDSHTDSHLFDIVEPKHPCAGGLTIDDVQRRLAQQVQDLHLDERFAVGKEVIGKNLAAGRERASMVFSKLYADMELLRENQRTRAEEQRADEKNGVSPTSGSAPSFKPDLTKVQGAAATVGNKAGAYVGSWATWANEKKKEWGRSASTSKRNSMEELPADFIPKDITPKVSVSASRPVSVIGATGAPSPRLTSEVWSGTRRPETQESYKESIFDADQATDDEDRRMDGTARQGYTTNAPVKVEEREDDEGFTDVALDSGVITPTPTTTAPHPIPAAEIVAKIERPIIDVIAEDAVAPVETPKPTAIQTPDVVSAPAVPAAAAETSEKVRVTEPTKIDAPASAPAAVLEAAPQSTEAAPRPQAKTTSSAVAAMRARFEAAQQELGKK